MKIIGIQTTYNPSTGKRYSVLHVSKPFSSYYSGENRECVGEAVSSINVGDYDISNLTVQDNIEIFYGETIICKKGAFAPVKLITLLD